MNDKRQHVGLVTGASRGLGLATARRLVAGGWWLVIDARDEDELGMAARSIGEPTRITAIAGDVTDPAHRSSLITSAVALGDLDLLINNASALGPSPQPPLAGYPLDQLRDVLETNLIAPLALIQESLPHLRRNRGTIVNITSDAAVEPYPTWGGYGSSKAGLNQMSNILAAEESDVTVIWFDPGDMNTRMHQDAFPGEDISDRPLPEERVPGLMTVIERGESGYFAAADLLESA